MSVKPKEQLEKRVDALEAIIALLGGVGEDVGYHNEIFNCYDDDGNKKRNEISANNSGHAYNTAKGFSNTIYRSLASLIAGNTNVIRFGENIFVIGYKCGTSGNNSIVCGEENGYSTNSQGVPIATNSAVNSIIAGYGNNNIGGSDLIAAGTGNKTGSSVSRSLIVGHDHNLSTLNDGLVCGYNASSTSDTRIAVGAGQVTAQNVFEVDRFGRVYATSYNTNSADYADLFEWLDGNLDNEDRRGMLVSFAGEKIIPAHGNDIDGVISNSPSVCGNDYQYWHGKYETDVYGRPLKDEAGKLIISKKYDRKKRYVPRSERPEWAPVGMCGRLVINDDGSCIPGSYVSARYGIGTKCFSPTRVKMLKRIDEKHIEVVVRG